MFSSITAVIYSILIAKEDVLTFKYVTIIIPWLIENVTFIAIGYVICIAVKSVHLCT